MRVVSEYDRSIHNLIDKSDDRLLDPLYSLVLRLKFMLAVTVILIMGSTIKLKIHGWKHITSDVKDAYPLVIALWHESLAVMSVVIRKGHYAVMCSPSADGDFITKLLTYMGYLVVRGSSNRKAVHGLLAHIREVKNGKNGATAVDGPKGPARKAKPGVVMLARKTGAKVTVLGAAYSNCIVLKHAWDNTKVPLPFSRVSIYAAEPFEIPSEMSYEEAAAYVNSRLEDAYRQAENCLKYDKESKQ